MAFAELVCGGLLRRLSVEIARRLAWGFSKAARRPFRCCKVSGALWQFLGTSQRSSRLLGIPLGFPGLSVVLP
eukprot:1884166-Alexandrium_andersonii.AAC.1